MARAQAAGVAGFVVIGVGRDLAPARVAVALATSRPSLIAATVGVHPHDATSLDDDGFRELEQLAADPCVVAIGEIGLDYHYDHSPREVQRDVFVKFVHLAKRVNKPIVIHTRSAAADTLEVLEGEGARDVGGIIHCFSEDRAFAERAFAIDFDVSFSGIVTFKKSVAIQDVATWAPEERVLVETDSPYLAPVPMRGKPCEPAYVAHTARKVAELRGVDFERFSESSSANAERRFRRRFSAS